MSQGTLYTTPQVRGILPRLLIQHYKLDIDVAPKDDPKFTKYFPIAKIPAFIGPKGFKLHEVISILVYFINLGEENSKLFGKNHKEYALILKWLSMINTEYMPNLAAGFRPLIGQAPYNKKVVETSLGNAEVVAKILEERLSEFTYLVGERLTLADLFGAVMFSRGFDTVYGDEWRKAHPSITRWFKTLIQTPILKSYYEKYEFREKAVEYVQPKKVKAPKAAPKAVATPKSKPKEESESDSEPTSSEPYVHPLKALANPKMPLNDWKKVYSNEDTRSKALPWFWEHYDPAEWSLYKVDYKYNDELTLTFMSNNLVGGFFNRLIGSTNYLFGCMVVYGENNNNGITGAFLVRGQDFSPAFHVAPDWESYEFTKLDHLKSDDRAFVDNMWGWDQPVIIGGEKKEIADGKVFK